MLAALRGSCYANKVYGTEPLVAVVWCLEVVSQALARQTGLNRSRV